MFKCRLFIIVSIARVILILPLLYDSSSIKQALKLSCCMCVIHTNSQFNGQPRTIDKTTLLLFHSKFNLSIERYDDCKPRAKISWIYTISSVIVVWLVCPAYQNGLLFPHTFYYFDNTISRLTERILVGGVPPLITALCLLRIVSVTVTPPGAAPNVMEESNLRILFRLSVEMKIYKFTQEVLSPVVVAVNFVFSMAGSVSKNKQNWSSIRWFPKSTYDICSPKLDRRLINVVFLYSVSLTLSLNPWVINIELTCLLKIEISSLNDSEEHTSPPWTPGSRGVHVANSHFSNISAKSGNNGCLEERKAERAKTLIFISIGPHSTCRQSARREYIINKQSDLIATWRVFFRKATHQKDNPTNQPSPVAAAAAYRTSRPENNGLKGPQNGSAFVFPNS